MKVIDLLNKIANGEEVPKKIKVNNMFVYEYDKDIDYKSKDGIYLFDSFIQIKKEDMNMEIEIIEENPTLNDIREKYGLPRIKDKKIPEKLEEIKNGDFLEIPSNHEIMNKINEIIDYLEK